MQPKEEPSSHRDSTWLIVYVTTGVTAALAITISLAVTHPQGSFKWLWLALTVVIVVAGAASIGAAAWPIERRTHLWRRAKAAGVRVNEAGDPWWILATVLLCIAGAAVIAAGIAYNVEAPARVTSAILFQDIANFGTFLAALAAWGSVAVSRRKSKKSRSTDTQTNNGKNHGMSENDLRFMTEYMNNVVLGRIDERQSAQIQGMLRAIRAAGGSSDLSASQPTLPTSENGGGGSDGLNAVEETGAIL